MDKIQKIIGQRIRDYRTQKNISQEKLAELAGCHHTYIGQIERGEKNATIESIEKIASALSISLSRLFENIENQDSDEINIPMQCYKIISSKSLSEQEQLYRILISIDKYKGL
jgi:transcriptional regulator with XRE-family HTH domain